MPSRLERLEAARRKIGLSDVEEVKELAIDFYLQVVERREKSYPPRLTNTVASGGLVTLTVG